MPIIEPPGDSQHLLQGDVFGDIRLFSTAKSWNEDGGELQGSSHKLCLVLSRPCVLEHNSKIVVAGIEKYPDNTPKGLDFTEVRVFLEATRDGVRTPNLFYLGQLPGKQGRFCARLDALHTVEIPSDLQVLLTFLEKRIGSLNPDFVRDLHTRLFTAFARLGFNDQDWLSDDDLNWLVEAGNQDVSAAKLDLSKAKTAQASHKAEGKYFEEGITEKLDSKVVLLQQQLEPFLNEKMRRQG